MWVVESETYTAFLTDDNLTPFNYSKRYLVKDSYSARIARSKTEPYWNLKSEKSSVVIGRHQEELELVTHAQAAALVVLLNSLQNRPDFDEEIESVNVMVEEDEPLLSEFRFRLITNGILDKVYVEEDEAQRIAKLLNESGC
jgi:hypothetical protein